MCQYYRIKEKKYECSEHWKREYGNKMLKLLYRINPKLLEYNKYETLLLLVVEGSEIGT